MAARGRRAKQRERDAKIRHLLFALLIVGAVAALVAYKWTRPAPIDPVTLCPSGGPTGHFVVLIDKTDPLTFTQNQAISVLLNDLVERRTPVGYLVSIFVLGEDFTLTAEPVAEKCNPGNGAGKTQLDTNLKWKQRAFEEKYLKPMLYSWSNIQTTSPAKWSPIFEMLQLVAINSFRKHDVAGERKLFVLSDMLHNTAQFSMYKGTPDYRAFAQTGYGRKSQADLRGVDVELFYLINTPQLQTRRNVLFWEQYFEQSGAKLGESRPLEG